MANQLRGKSKVKPKHPPPPPPVPNPQSFTQEQMESTDETQSDENLYKNTELPEKSRSGPAEGLYMIPDDEHPYFDPDERAPPPTQPLPLPPPPSILQEVNQKPEGIVAPVRPPLPPSILQPSPPPPSSVEKRKQKPARPPLPSSRTLRRWVSEGSGTSLYRTAELRSSLMRQTETESESNQPQPDEQSENPQSGLTDPQEGSPALPAEHVMYHNSTVLTRQESVEEFKHEPQEEPLYVDVLEEPQESLYIDPDELNLPVFKRKPKPSRPPPPSSASVRYSPSPQLFKPRELQRSVLNDYGHPSQKPSLHPQLSLPSRLPMRRAPKQAPLNCSNDEFDMLMKWWNTTKCWEKVYRSNISQGQEQNTQPLISEARGVCLAVRLFECLLFHRGKIFNSHITQLYGLADKLDETNKKAKVVGITGGSVAAATGIVLAPFTLGLSLTATAIGVGVAVHGAKGGSSTITDKWYSSQERKKVEEILQDYKAQMADVDGCLHFINVGMERLRKFEPPVSQGMDDEVVKIMRVARILGRDLGDMVPTSAQHKVLQGLVATMDVYFQEQEKLKKGTETKLARKMREMAKQMKSSLDELMSTRNRIREAMEQAET